MTRRAFSVSVFVYDRVTHKVLLINHKRMQTWLPIGGEIEPGETPSEAAARELKEETGLDASFKQTALDGRPFGMLGYEEHDAGSKGLHLNFVFASEYPESKPYIQFNDEFSDYAWVGSDELKVLDCPENVRMYGSFTITKMTLGWRV